MPKLTLRRFTGMPPAPPPPPPPPAPPKQVTSRYAPQVSAQDRRDFAIARMIRESVDYLPDRPHNLVQPRPGESPVECIRRWRQAIDDFRRRGMGMFGGQDPARQLFSLHPHYCYPVFRAEVNPHRLMVARYTLEREIEHVRLTQRPDPYIRLHINPRVDFAVSFERAIPATATYHTVELGDTDIVFIDR